MPTVALLNGHTFAGGLMVAMMHDYRIMNPHKGFLCLNELQLGVGLRPPMCSIFREKVKPSTFRRMILEAVRFKVSLGQPQDPNPTRILVIVADHPNRLWMLWKKAWLILWEV